MCYDIYDFRCHYTSGNAIAIQAKDVKQILTESHVDDKAVHFSKHEIERLLEIADGFKIYCIGKERYNGKPNDYLYILAMKYDESLHQSALFNNDAHYDFEYTSCQCTIEKKAEPDDPEYQDLFKLARKLTPQGTKLYSPPGQYAFALDTEFAQLWELNPWQSEQRVNSKIVTEERDRIPLDVSVTAGEGNTRRTIKCNKAVLCVFLPGLHAIFKDAACTNVIVFSNLNADAVEFVIFEYTGMGKRPQRFSWTRKEMNAVKKKFGVDKSKSTKEDPLGHPALDDAHWLDVTFLIGESKEVVKANRAVLASFNAVLYRFLYGTERIEVDLSKPIEFPHFESGEAFRYVLFGIVNRRKSERAARQRDHETVVPLHLADSVKSMADYLLESEKSLNFYYETEFQRESEKGFGFTKDDLNTDLDSDSDYY